ncbi:MAG: CdaR family protein [Chloroflexota bacterium]|nr:CdaR family protein [Chloroflexota bacterium]
MRATAYPAVILRRFRPRRTLLRDFPLKAAAAIVAVVLWAVLVQSAPREITVAFDGRVPVERPVVPSGQVLRGQLGDVAVRLRGPEGVVDRMALADLKATLDLSGLDPTRPEPQDVPVRMAAADARVKVVEVVPAAIAVRVERITSRAAAVQARLGNEPAKGTVAGDATFVPAEVTLSGPESLVASVAAVYATVRFGDTAVDVIQSVQPIAVDASGQVVDAVSVDPAAIQVSIPVLPSATTRTVPVLWTLRGAVANGFWISRVVTDPFAVTLQGPAAALASLDRVETGAVDVTGISSSRSVRVPLVLPDGVAPLRPQDAVVSLTVVPLTGSRPFPLIAIQVTGIGAGLSADLDQRTVELLLTGTVGALAGVGVEQVTATVDASGKGPGTYPVDVVVRVPQGAGIESVQPARVTLTIKTR